jgi:hypothetical protein
MAHVALACICCFVVSRRNVTVFSSHLDAYTIEHGSDKKSSGPDLLLSYHDNDHYNSVRPSSGSKPPPPIKTYVEPPQPISMQQEPVQENSNESEESEMVVEETASTTNTSEASTKVTDVEVSETAAVRSSMMARTKKNLCPCGSGLRNKKCCASKAKLAARAKKLRNMTDGSSDVNGTGTSGDGAQREPPIMNGTFRVLHI